MSEVWNMLKSSLPEFTLPDLPSDASLEALQHPSLVSSQMKLATCTLLSAAFLYLFVRRLSVCYAALATRCLEQFLKFQHGQSSLLSLRHYCFIYLIFGGGGGSGGGGDGGGRRYLLNQCVCTSSLIFSSIVTYFYF